PQEIPQMSSTNRIRTLIAGTALAAALALPLSFAAASSELDGVIVGKTADEITSSLVAQGYEVKKVKPEDGMLEAYALKDGKRYEVYVDTTTGMVSKVKEEN
ncbi:MAG TPA: PepSY domain-containing protein, partial [Thermohalobaculum sp.]|nr:PepSY domain-containing protein [Thermohalobaculum sp.]